MPAPEFRPVESDKSCSSCSFNGNQQFFKTHACYVTCLGPLYAFAGGMNRRRNDGLLSCGTKFDQAGSVYIIEFFWLW